MFKMQSILNKRGSAEFYNKIFKKKGQTYLRVPFLHSEIGSVYMRLFLIIKAFYQQLYKVVCGY